MGEASKQLTSECKSKLQELEDVDLQWQRIRKPVVADDKESAQARIDHAKEKQLKAQLSLVSNADPDPLPVEPATLRELLKEDLTQSVEQLEQILSLIRPQHQELNAELKNMKKLNEQHKMMNETLLKKLEYLEQNPDKLEEKALLGDSEEKFQTISTYLKELMKKLHAFVHSNFPPPTGEETAQWKKGNTKGRRRSGAGESSDVRSYCSLQSMLEALMNQCVQYPHDPYIILDPETHWQPYVQLLLRCGIALRHPQDDNKIRLTPFYQ